MRFQFSIVLKRKYMYVVKTKAEGIKKTYYIPKLSFFATALTSKV